MHRSFQHVADWSTRHRNRSVSKVTCAHRPRGRSALLVLAVLAITALPHSTLTAADVDQPFPAGAMLSAPNGSGTEALPLGWTLPKWAQAGGRRAEEDGQGILRFIWPHQGHVWPTCTVPVDPRWAELRIALRVRITALTVKDGSGGGFLLRTTFHRADGGVITHRDAPLIDRPSAWTTVSVEGAVPEGAATVSINPGFMHASGAFDLADLSFRPRWRDTPPHPLPILQPVLPEEAPVKPVAEPAAVAIDAPVPVPPTLALVADDHWGREPAEELTPARGRMVLSGVWNVLPATSREGTWGAIRVPGSWKASGLPGIVRAGEGAAWSDDLNTVSAMWYARTVTVPAAWQGRTITVDLTRLSTDAVVFVDGVFCGRIGQTHGTPAFGTVDVTKAIRFGQPSRLDILVSAGLAETEVVQMMGIGEGQQVKRKVSLPVCGLIGDVIVHSRPRGAHVSDVFVQPSVRRSEVQLDIEVTGLAEAGQVVLVAEMLDESGAVERTFRATVSAQAGEVQTLRATFPWADARRWDLAQPNRYVLRLSATAPGLADVYWQPFGFREFWIEGRDFMLNGTPFRLRPVFRGFHNGFPALIDSQIDADMAMGFNFQELWPDNPYELLKYQDLVAERADRKGWPISGIAMPIQRLAATWSDPAVQEKFLIRMRRDLRRLRNHPSIIMWGSSGNFFGHEQDQNPRYLGRQDWIPEREQESWAYGNRRITRDIVARMKQEDPTRPLFLHHGTHVGDFPTTNAYLNFTPLQEREEWISDWAKNHPLPWLAVEFGLPLEYSFHRARGHANVVHSERLYTERLATMTGPEVYADEPESYRRFHRDFFGDAAGVNAKARGYGQDMMPTGQWAHSHMDVGSGERTTASYHDFIGMHVRNTWRSWRTWGLSSMPIPWTFPRGLWSYPGDRDAQVALPPFVPGQRGAWLPELPQRQFWSLPDTPWTLTPTAAAMHDVSRATLAWISGPEDVFTAKDHSFWSGDTLVKSAVLINDQRQRQRYDLTWTATLAGSVVGTQRLTGELQVGETRHVPIRFAVTATAKADGAIDLTGMIGKQAHTDRFDFRVFPRPQPATGEVLVHDPRGHTTRMLRALGYTVRPWTGQTTTDLVVIGREALAQPVPADLQRLIAAGGRVLVMAQHPDWTRDALGLRVARHMSRRVFRIDAEHPVVAGLDDEDLRDWAGVSTLVEPYPEVGTANQAMPYGWKWGNRGGLTSGAIEKPHHAGWRPLLECEFDLAYTPLMELDHGRGRMIWCALDLEDFVPQEPAAVLLARQLLVYAATAPLRPRVSEVAVLAGSHPLAELGVRHQVVTHLPEQGLVVIPGDADIADDALHAFVQRGGRVLLLPRHGPRAPLGVVLTKVDDAGRGVALPDWPELAGISSSDLRARAPIRAWTVSSGAETAAGGLIGRVPIGTGVAIFAQFDLHAHTVDEEPWLRFVRWRQTRALTQLLANLGAELALDAALPALRSSADTVPLAGTWQVQAVGLVKGSRDIAKKLPITPISPAALRLVGASVDDADWLSTAVPGMWAGFNDEMYGEAVFRRQVMIPEAWAGQDLVLKLGALDDADTTFWNGEEVGTGEGWNQARHYVVPGHLVKPGLNVLAVRLFNNYLDGGFNAKPDELYVVPKNRDAGPVRGYYHPDYRADFPLGDDPYRYQRW